ncbi:MAG: transporter [Saprospiraceae bacterium]|nr:transporter [Saprospiraceae bacterium]
MVALVACNKFGLGQTCCSSGVPISNSLGLPNQEANHFQALFSYDYNYLDQLNTGTENLGSINRRRRTQSVLAQFGYTFNEYLSVEGLASHVSQLRRNTLNSGEEENTKTSGIGDIVLLGKYNVFGDELGKELSIGLGAKLPTGSADQLNNEGRFIIADLQPGSGSLDGIAWLRYSLNITKKGSRFISINPSYKWNGSYDDYLNNTATYRFGNELQIFAALNDQFVVAEKLLNTSIGVRYRDRARDQQAIATAEELELPGTGGAWFIAEPSLLYQLNNSFAILMNADIPLYSDVNETQLTPTYRLNGGIAFSIPTKHSNE